MSAAEERRRAVVRAVAAIEGRTHYSGVMAFHVVFFGIEECVLVKINVVKGDLRWLRERGHVRQVAGGSGQHPGQFVATETGKQWAGIGRAENREEEEG